MTVLPFGTEAGGKIAEFILTYLDLYGKIG
jgi:hypothetical protein